MSDRLHPGDTLRLAGKDYVVTRIDWPESRIVLEPLGEKLASVLYVDDGEKKEPLVLRDALIAAGWVPP